MIKIWTSVKVNFGLRTIVCDCKKHSVLLYRDLGAQA